MRFIDYLKGTRLALLSDLPPGTVARRLEAELDPMWMPFTKGVVGWVAFGRFALRYRRSAWFRQDWLPVLAGRIHPHGAGSRITVHYRASRPHLLTFALWACLLVAFILNPSANDAMILGPLIFIGAAVLLTVTIGIASLGDQAQRDLAEMLAVVEAAADRAA